MTRGCVGTIGLLAGAVSLAAAAPAAAQVEIEAAGKVRAELHLLGQLDWRDTGAGEIDVRRARVGIKGSAFERIEYELEHDFRNDGDHWRDLFLNVPLARAIEVRVGRFKAPFSLDQLTAAADLDFADRSLAARYLAPGRDTGVMAHGRLAGRRLRYQLGLFRTGGDNVRDAERLDPRHGAMAAGRFVARPWAGTRSTGWLDQLSVGAAVTLGRVPEGQYSLRGRTVTGEPFFPDVAVHGIRRRIGVELDWRIGSLAVTGEAMRVRDERLGQGIDDERLADVVAQGWHVDGAWVLAGATRGGGEREGLEVTARLERLQIGSPAARVTALIGPRASLLPLASTDAWTVGVNWYPIRFLKLQANLVRERLDGSGVGPEGPRGWYPVARIQFRL